MAGMPTQTPAEVTVNVFPGGFNWGIYAAQELLDPQDGFFRQGRIDMTGLKTVLELRSRYAKPAKPLDDPMKYYDPSYHMEAMSRAQ